MCIFFRLCLRFGKEVVREAKYMECVNQYVSIRVGLLDKANGGLIFSLLPLISLCFHLSRIRILG
jgi:hypothetical protein